LDGPVVTAARAALERDDVTVVLPFVPAVSEEEVTQAFEATQRARRLGPDAASVADRYFFETVVRVHRAGEGAPFTGLKPAGLDVGPVIPVAERAIASGDCEPLAQLLEAEVRDEVARRFEVLMQLQAEDTQDMAHARAYVQAMLGLQVWANAVHRAIRAPAHGASTGHAAGPGARDAP
jgi:hypothetical protein